MLTVRDEGLYVPAGDFWIDPWRPAAAGGTAVITHAHSDHARAGAALYVCAPTCAPLLRQRLGADLPIRTVDWGQRVELGGVTVSLHPAGHVLGSAQVRLELDGQVWVVSGDYKRTPDPSCEPFEVVPCDVFITEATFALPVYRWDDPQAVVDELLAWWHENRAANRPSIVYAYALGKAQRILAHLGDRVPEPVLVHGAVEPINGIYREAGIQLAPTVLATSVPAAARRGGVLVIAPPGASDSTFSRSFPQARTAFASGWMRVRGQRRRRSHDRGFVLSDHADWDGLLQTIQQTGAKRVLATHGRTDVLIRALADLGIEGQALSSQFHNEGDGDV